jgi:hypothetical protein
VSSGLDSFLKQALFLNQEELNFKTNERDEISSNIDKLKTLFTLNKFHKHLPQNLSIIIKNINTIKLLLSFDKSHGEGGDICVSIIDNVLKLFNVLYCFSTYNFGYKVQVISQTFC